MSETRDGRVRADSSSRVDSELVKVPLPPDLPRSQVRVVREDALATIREDAHRLAVECVELERQLLEGTKVLSDSNHARDLLAASRDVLDAFQHFLGMLGGEIPHGSPLAATRRRVLVVDDLVDTTDIIAAVLEDAGFEVVTARNGLEGLLAAHRSRPRLIVMDLQMPVLDGIEATRLLKVATATQHIPVLAHTARPDSCQVPLGQLFAHVLPKPTMPDVLLALVRRYVRD